MSESFSNTEEVLEKATRARAAAKALALLPSTTRDSALVALAAGIRAQHAYLLAQNALDVEAARAAHTAEPLIDRLLLTPQRLEGIASALEALAKLPDPLGEVLSGHTLYNGLQLRQLRVPLGVVAMIYEARPNVTADAAGLCLKTGNACLLRGGSLAVRSNLAFTQVLVQAGKEAGLPQHWLQSIESTDRSATTQLMQLHGLIDVLIPRGSAALIRATVEQAKVPVIETGEGNCHLYVHQAARPEIIVPIALNAKIQRPGVCNAIESLLIDQLVFERLAPALAEAFAKAGVLMHGDAQFCELAQSLGAPVAQHCVPATIDDWAREYLDLEISCKVVSGLYEAINHINTYSTHHSESILSEDHGAVQRFFAEVDSAAVYANASTRFTDGGEFGLGAEIGISTQKLHARGPMGLTALTSSKFLLDGSGQIRA